MGDALSDALDEAYQVPATEEGRRRLEAWLAECRRVRVAAAIAHMVETHGELMSALAGRDE